MTITLADLPHFELMERLKSTPATPPAPKTPPPPSHTPSFAENFLTLTSKLRAEGFSSHANRLEEQFALYASAASQNPLYRAHTETGEELIEFAHPDGDVEMAPAKDHMGDVETLVSQHQKILEVAKQPKPRKTAQQNPNAFPLKKLSDRFRAFAAEIGKYLADRVNTPSADQGQDFQTVQFYRTANAYNEIAAKLAAAFNLPGTRSIPQIIQVIKGALEGTIAQPQASQITDLAHIDSWIGEVLGWLQENNPVKKKAELIGMVKQALLLPIVVEFLTHTDTLNYNIVRNAGLLSYDLDAVLADPNSADVHPLINEIKAYNRSLQTTIDKFKASMTGTDIGAAEDYARFLAKYGYLLHELDAAMVGPGSKHEQNSQGIFGQIHSVLLADKFQDVSKDIHGLQGAIADQQKNIDAFLKKAQATSTAGEEETSNIQQYQKSIQDTLRNIQAWKKSLADNKEYSSVEKNDLNKFLSNQAAKLNAIFYSYNEENVAKLKTILGLNDEFAKQWM